MKKKGGGEENVQVERVREKLMLIFLGHHCNAYQSTGPVNTLA
jgi:hypothetical protein